MVDNFSDETFVFPNRMPAFDWEKQRKEYVVFYIFDNDGNHLATNHWYAGTTSEADKSVMSERLEQMIYELGKTVFCDIEVKPFQTIVDGIAFGLIRNDEYETVDLEPSSTISFHEPWDGDYDT